MGMGAIGIGVILGLFVGHFLAVCIYRIPRQQSLWGGRRLCPHCQAAVGWQDKIPLLGYMLNQGRCRYCQEAIGVQQVTAELAMAALGGVAVWQGETWLQSGAFMVLAAFLLLISFIDYEWQLIFDKVLVLFAVCGLAISVFGSDYDTVDGTGVRDYIHVLDLARGHIKALEKHSKINKIEAYNLGAGKGYSVLQLVEAFEKANGVKIPYAISERRAGDVATCYADSSKAKEQLGWEAEKTIEDMCKDSWNWQSKNPNGY